MFAGDGAGVVGRRNERKKTISNYLSETHNTNIECLHKDSEEMGFVSAMCANMPPQKIHVAVANNLGGYFKKSP